MGIAGQRAKLEDSQVRSGIKAAAELADGVVE